MSTTFYIENHDKAEHPIYQLVPEVSQILLEEIPSIAGIVFGGTYAVGSYKDGDIVNVNVIYDSIPSNYGRIEVRVKDCFTGRRSESLFYHPLPLTQHLQ